MSEAASSAHIFAPYCSGKLGIDVGYGGKRFLNEVGCLAVDMIGGSYTKVGDEPQTIQADMGNLSMFCDGSLDYIASHHLLEDAYYYELRDRIIPEWRRVLKPGGLILTNCPDQQRYLEVNRRNGTMDTINLAHKEQDFSLLTWNENVVARTGSWEVLLEVPEHGDYSWLQILRKI
jgi:predicted SAM-dependent methyltransferase